MSFLPQGTPIDTRTGLPIQLPDNYAAYQYAQGQTFYPTVWPQWVEHRVVQQIPTQDGKAEDSLHEQSRSGQIQTAMFVDEVAQTEFTKEEFPGYLELFPPLDQLESVQILRGKKEDKPSSSAFGTSSVDSLRSSLPEVPTPFSYFSETFNDQLRIADSTTYRPQRPGRGRGRNHVHRNPYYIQRGRGRGQVMVFRHASKEPKT